MARDWPGHGPARRPPKPRDDADAPRGFKARVRSAITPTAGTVRGSRRVFQLVWEASRSLTLTLATVTIISGLIPAAQAYTAKLLVNAVVRAVLVHARHAPDRTVLDVALLWGSI